MLAVIIGVIAYNQGRESNSTDTATIGGNRQNTKQTTASLELTSTGAVIVHYYKSGFSPKNITVAPGTSVHFVNESSDALSISAVDQTNQPYAALSQGKSIGIGESFDFAFGQSGAYTYYNINHREDFGVVYVK